jgi:hypothetical protein
MLILKKDSLRKQQLVNYVTGHYICFSIHIPNFCVVGVLTINLLVAFPNTKFLTYGVYSEAKPTIPFYMFTARLALYWQIQHPQTHDVSLMRKKKCLPL